MVNGSTSIINFFFGISFMLSVCTGEAVSILELPGSLTIGFILLEIAVIFDTVGEYPFTINHISFTPFTDKSHLGIKEDISSLFKLFGISKLSDSVLFVIFPFSLIGITSCIG